MTQPANHATDGLAGEDARSRARALDIAHSYIVQAPAGSGKTELLTQRVLALLASVDAPEQVVAMTFTRKAAAEMRRRILNELLSDRPPEACSAAHERRTRELAMAARARNSALGWQLESAPQRLRITTIDSFCGMLVRRAPVLSMAGGMPEVVDNADAHYQDAALRVLGRRDDPGDPISAAVRRLLDHVDHNVPRLLDMLAQLLRRRDAWRGMLSATAPGDEARQQLEHHLHGLCAREMERALQLLPAAMLDSWWESACSAAAALPEDTALAAAVAIGHLPSDAGECGHWQRLCGLLLTREGSLRKSVSKNEGFPPGNKLAKQAHLALLDELRNIPGAEEAVNALARLATPAYSAGQWEVIQDLLLVFSHAVAELRLCFAEAGAVDHSEVALRALQALGDEADGPSPLLLRLDHRIQHLLVDEFQDTSDVQMALLQRLTAGWTAGDGRTLFLVGDPMQSIYRFRNANVGLFIQAREHGIGDVRLTSLRLGRNFRSQQGVVDWVNGCFPQVLRSDDLQRGTVAYSPAVAHHPMLDGAAAVQWHLGDAQREAEAVVRLIAAIPDGESIAILVRSRNHVRDILPALRAAGIPVQAVEIDPLLTRPVVQDLLALTRALCAPGDRIAWLSLLRAPWCGASFPALQELCSRLSPRAPLWTALSNSSALAGLEAADAARIARLLPPMQQAMALRGRVPIATLVEQTWLALGGPACVRDDSALLDARSMLRKLAEVSASATTVTAAELDAALSGLYAESADSGPARVQVMTMHKAKGLQFDHVLLPGLHRGGGQNTRPALAQSSLMEADGHERPLLAPIPRSDEDADALFDLLDSHVEGARDRAEAGRLLYVAATRAVRSLHLFADVTLNQDGSPRLGNGLLAHLWPGVANDILPSLDPATQRAATPAGGDQTTAADGDAAASSLYRLPMAWQPPPPPQGLVRARTPGMPFTALPPFEWAGERARVAGTLYHLCVEMLAGKPLDDWDRARCDAQRGWLQARAADFGLDEADAATVAGQVIEALHHTLDDDTGRWLLSDHADGHASELALDCLHDGVFRRMRIDRTFIDGDGARWIVDYKTGRHEGGDLDRFIAEEADRYRDQLARYARLFSHEERRIRLALYLPLLPPGRRLIEIPAPPA